MLEFTSPETLGLNMGAAGILGFIVGYAAKKVIKLMAVLLGAQMAILAYLERTGVVSVDWGALTGQVDQTIEAGQSVGTSLVSTLAGISALGGSFLAGTGLGFKRA